MLTVLISSYSYSQTKNYAKEAETLWASGMYEQAADAYKKASEKMSVKNDKAKDKKFCDFIKDDTEETFQIMEPSFTLKEKSLLS